MEIEDIKRIDLRPGDGLLVRLPADASLKDMENLKSILSGFLPGVPILILHDNIKIDVLPGGVS